jgi:hypothetical protein
MPLVHVAPVAQVVPQAPQLEASLPVATQRPLHNEVPAGHTQAPAVQSWPMAHV